ncbi:unnamed protein product [Rhizophagus irregularis]|nr:unnamed protein product [Rhizophagus irregularis]
MNSKNLEQLLNINKFLSTTPPPNIHSVQDYVSTINISGIFSITFDTPHETLPPLTNIDNTAEKILHLQYPHLTSAAVFSNGDCLLNSISLIFNANQMLALQFRLAMVVELMKFSNFYLSQKIFEQDYYFSDIALNSAKNSDMLTTYNKEREYIGEIAYISKPHQFCSIIGLYGLASIILFFKRNSLPSPDQNIDIEMRDVQSDGNENIPFNILESEKCISDGSDIVEFNSNVDDNDGESSSSSSYTTNNEKNVRKKQTRNSQKRIMKLDHIKDKRLQNHPKKFRKHSKTSNCLLTEGIRPLTSYFVNSIKSHQISCIGLRDEKHLEYLQRIGGIIHYGGAPRVEVLAKELFPIKFDKNFSWKRLTNNEKIKLENELVARAKWRNDFNSNCIRSVKCKITTTNKGRICKKYMKLNSNKILMNAIERPIPKIENRKFTPKFIIKKNPIFKYLNDSNLNELYYSVDSKQDSFWPILAEKGRQGVFKNKKVFEGLCKVMLEIANREQNNKGNQNLQYTENFANFTTILASLGTRGYKLFKQNLAGRTLRNIRLHHAQSDDAIINTELCYENMVRFKRFADSLNYNGPVAAMTDNTKLKERLSYSATLGCVIGSTLSTSETKASNYKEIIAIIDKIKVKNAIAKQVRVYLLQIPLPKIPPIVIDHSKDGLFIYLFIIGELIDAYQSRTISHNERLRMAILAESLILLILAYRDYYPSVPLLQSIPKIMHMFRTHTNASLAKINAEKTSAEGYITNYYEDTIADNIHLTIYPTDDEIHLIIHEAHEQAIAFAKVLEFIGYKNLFYDSTFNTHVLACESDLLDDDLNQDHDDLSQDDDLNQDDDGLEEINKADCELNEISKAAELVSTYNIFNLEKTDDLEQSQIDYIYGQSDKKIIQKSSDIFQTGVLSSGELDISYLISQRRKHEAYSNQRMERIYVAHDSALNLNPNKINNIVALAQNDGAKTGNLRTKR